MKTFSKYVDAKLMESLLDPVEDFFEHVNDDVVAATPTLKEKHRKMKLIEKAAGVSLKRILQDKLNFKAFNENSWAYTAQIQELVNKEINKKTKNHK